MKKMLRILAVLSLMIVSACFKTNEIEESKTVNKNITPTDKITLTEAEAKQLGNNGNVIAQVLVRKAIENEMALNPFTEDQLKHLEIVKKNIEVEFFLETLAGKNVQVFDHEVLSIYESNSEAFKDKDPATILPQIRQGLYSNKIAKEKANVINGFVTKYELNEELKKYYTPKTSDAVNPLEAGVTETKPEVEVKTDGKAEVKTDKKTDKK